MKVGDLERKLAEEEQEEALSPLKYLKLVNRKDLDFTEQLWKLLKGRFAWPRVITSNAAFVHVPLQYLKLPLVLWNIPECASYQELTDSLQVIFKSLQTAELQPMVRAKPLKWVCSSQLCMHTTCGKSWIYSCRQVHKSNKSQLAQLVRDSYFKHLSMPSLDGTVPLELLVGIGIEKMRRDYAHALVGMASSVKPK